MINEFSGKYSFLSNFYPSRLSESPYSTYATVEHAFQAAKTLDLNMHRIIACADTPGQAKRLGNQCDLRSDWNAIKYSVMYKFVAKKFHKKGLSKKLIDTSPHFLCEGNTWHDNLQTYLTNARTNAPRRLRSYDNVFFSTYDQAKSTKVFTTPLSLTARRTPMRPGPTPPPAQRQSRLKITSPSGEG